MIRSRPLILALLLVCGVVAAHSQDLVRLTPDEAVDLAIKNNLSLESARVTLDKTKRQSDYVWNQFLPTVGLQGQLTHDNWATASSPTISLPGTGTPVSIPGAGSGRMNPTMFASDPITGPQWHANGALSASLDFNFALIEGIKTVRLNYQTGLVTLERARLQLEQNVRKTYSRLLLMQEQVALAKANLATAERRFTMAEANYKAGLVPRLTALQAQVAMENMKPTINESENGLKGLLANFAMSLGLPYDTQFEFVPFSESDFNIPLDVAELISKAASGKPDILELQRNIQALDSQRKATALQMYTPTLRLQWTLASVFSPMMDPFKDGFFTADNWNKGGSFSITLMLSLNNYLPFTKEGQSLKNSDNDRQKLNIMLAQTIQGTELEIYNLVNSLEKTRTTAEAMGLTVKMAEESYRLTEEAYRAGLQDFLEVHTAADSLNQAKLALLNQQFNYLSDLIDLEYATGVPFGTLSSKNRN